MGRIVAVGSVVAGLALLQVLISASPVQLSPSGRGTPAALAYRVDDVTPFSLRLTLFDPSRRVRVGAVRLLPVARGGAADPLAGPTWILPVGLKRNVLSVRFLARPATYKLELPGVEPFGDVSVGRR